MRLYLDDVRPTPKGFDVRAYTADEAIRLLKTGKVVMISFDHDLGEPESEVGNGYQVAKWIEEEAHTNPNFVVPDWRIHSANPVGAGNIHRAMISANRAYHGLPLTHDMYVAASTPLKKEGN